MHRAISGGSGQPDIANFSIYGEIWANPLIGRLVEYVLDAELKGSGYVMVASTDGRTHHVRFPDLYLTADVWAGAILETQSSEDEMATQRLSLATRSGFTLAV
ncbi:DUF3363 domain-containing protein [Acetobacter fabarum]|uniref:DUF3363 domain-containing protein n=1 Tax=Acetobacter fabarum TaxID=483199 RepID=UPI0033B198D6